MLTLTPSNTRIIHQYSYSKLEFGTKLVNLLELKVAWDKGERITGYGSLAQVLPVACRFYPV